MPDNVALYEKVTSMGGCGSSGKCAIDAADRSFSAGHLHQGLGRRRSTPKKFVISLLSLDNSGDLFRKAALATLYVHFVVVMFNIFWLIVVPVGAWQAWRFVHNYWWRLVHLLALMLVAAQTLAGRLCFLTSFQDYLQGQSGAPMEPPSLLTRVVARAVFWPLPDWVFAPLYVLALAFAAILWIAVPPVHVPRLNR